ncbi:MAG: S1 RNA-binding domain-containing protein [Ruminococcus sp.]
MQVENGKIYEGTVRSITKYGAFVDIANPENQRLMGMVHISEISRSYVNEIKDFVTEGQAVKVKVIGIGENGKISLSMKQAEPVPVKLAPRPAAPKRDTDSRPNVWEPKKKTPQSEMTFEDMLSRFKQNSEERMCDIKRNTERKNHSRRK